MTRLSPLRQRRYDTNGSVEKPDTSEIDYDNQRRLTLSWWEIPAWMQDNEYILSGYRRLVLQYLHSA